MDKIERVARALCDRNPDAMVPQAWQEVIKAGGVRKTVDGPPIPAWRLFEAKARAAIDAMGEEP